MPPPLQVYYRPLMSDLEPQGVEGTPSSPIPITVTATTSAPSTALTREIMGLTPNTEYEVMVCATNGAGCGSNETGSVRTTEDGKFLHMYIGFIGRIAKCTHWPC